MLALLLETVRVRRRSAPQLARAAAMAVPVIALKVGRTESAKAMVTAHSGALAGEHGAYEAVFDAHGVQEVRTLDELADAMELFSLPAARRRPGGGSRASTTPVVSARSSSISRTTSTYRSRRSRTTRARNWTTPSIPA